MIKRIKDIIIVKAIDLTLFAGLLILFVLARYVPFNLVPDYLGVEKVLAKRDVLNLVATILASVFGFFLAFVILGFQILQARYGSHVSVFLDKNKHIKKQVTLITFALMVVVWEYLTEVTWNLSVIYLILGMTLVILFTLSETSFALFKELLSEKYMRQLAESITYFGLDRKLKTEPAFDKLLTICKIQIRDGNPETAALLIKSTSDIFWNHIVEICNKSARGTHYHNTLNPFAFLSSFFWKPLIDQCKQYNDYETALVIVWRQYIFLNDAIRLNEECLLISNLAGHLKEISQYVLQAGFEVSAGQQMIYVHTIFRTLYAEREIVNLNIPEMIKNPGFDKITVYSLHGEIAGIVSTLVNDRNRQKDFAGAISIIDKYEWSAAIDYTEQVSQEMRWKLDFLICNEAAEMRKKTLRLMDTQEAVEQVRFAGKLFIQLELDNPHLNEHLNVIIRYHKFLAENGMLTGSYHSPMQGLYMAGVNALEGIDSNERFLQFFKTIVDAMVTIRHLSASVEVHMAIMEYLFYYIHLLEKGDSPKAPDLIVEIKLAINKCTRETYKQYKLYKADKKLFFQLGIS